ncbi:MAG: hypothetical protein AM326_05770 [Candidatus Thorarchaeota archaeon SMTZ-45]|nr:MAG: hypothetical protein AM325_00420 [Candidatus Thorarchaeota archaeon SMTZ1-45]KXH77106.1 MAG: hypothetical protein AM326_05770 [Candidatus Thorarchaeota archaeon SMTZ-45]
MSSDEIETDEDMIKQAKQLLLLTDLVDKYPQVVSRRVAGLVYILIGGGISFATLILMSLQNLIGPGDPFLVNIGFVIISLVFSWVIGFRLIVPLTQSYPAEPSRSEGGGLILVLWGVIGVAIVVSSLVLFQMGLHLLFPSILQFIMGFGFTINYLAGRRSSTYDFYSREHLYFSIAIFLSIIPMLIFLEAAYLILIVVDMGGIYIIGIFMLITAERLLLESKRQG